MANINVNNRNNNNTNNSNSNETQRNETIFSRAIFVVKRADSQFPVGAESAHRSKLIEFSDDRGRSKAKRRESTFD